MLLSDTEDGLMSANVTVRCKLCTRNDLQPAMLADGSPSDYLICPNCDGPKGKVYRDNEPD